MSPRRLVYIPAVALGLALLPLPRTPAPVLADDLLVITADVSYDIRPDSGPVHVSWQVLVDNRDPQTAEQQSGTTFFYALLSLPVPRGAAHRPARAAAAPLRVPPYPVSPPAVSFGQESTVSVTTPSDSAWEVNLEPGDCGAGPVFACRASSADEVTWAALAGGSRPRAG